MSDTNTFLCSNTPYCVELPYPSATKVQKSNTYYASILAEDYAGAKSEMTAMTSYMYSSLLTSSYNEEVSCILRRIGVAEMTHISLLGKLICALGCPPKFMSFSNNDCTNWDASYLCYDSNLKDILKNAILSERGAVTQYKEHRKLINDSYVQAVLDRIILDEELHESTLSYYYDKCR